MLQGDQTTYSVNVTRFASFNGQVKLSVSGLPGGATASWNPSATVPASSSGTSLQIGTVRSIPVGSYDLTITGRRHHRGQVDVSIHGRDAGRPADA